MDNIPAPAPDIMTPEAIAHALADGSSAASSSDALQGCMIVEGACVSIHPSADAVFYNKVQIFNRDLSVCVLHAFAQLRAETGSRKEASQARARFQHRHRDDAAPADSSTPGLFICEALAASGLRSVRYARELGPFVDRILVNDLDPAAMASISRNASLNGVTPLCVPVQRDAVDLLYAHKAALESFDVVDLDPYGSASVFLDGAVQAACDGGLLAVTCTDMQVLAGTDMHAARAKYGATPIRTRAFGEQALRVLLAAVEASANRYHRSVQPLVSVAVDFYIRIFVRVWQRPLLATASALRVGAHTACNRCHAAWTWPAGVVTKREKGKRHRAGVKRRPVRDGEAAAAVDVDDDDDHDQQQQAEEGGAAAAVEVPPARPASPHGERDPRRLACHTSDGSAAHSANVRTQANTAFPLGDRCPHCDGRLVTGGPLWLDPIHDIPFAQRVLATMTSFFGGDGRGHAGATALPQRYYDMSVHTPRPAHDAGSNSVDTVALSRQRLMGVMRSIAEELPDVPLYFDAAALTSTLRMNSVPLAAIIAGLHSGGYRASLTHAASNCIKTDAPAGFVWDVMRTWTKTQPGAVAPKNLTDTASLTYRILCADLAFPEKPVSFASQGSVAAAMAALKHDSGPRFVPNPGAHWGPGSRASAAIAERRKRERTSEAAGDAGMDVDVAASDAAPS